MIHYLTVHFEDPGWVDIQTDFIRRYSPSDTRIHAILTDLPGDYSNRFDRVHPSPHRDHAKNLNFLADRVIADGAGPDDVLVFVDGDAFPIRSIAPYLERLEREDTVIAVQRRENNGDRQPHPCFAMIKVATWREIAGDWSAGYKWRDAQGDRITDVGGNMLRILEERDMDWVKLLRTNAFDLHDLFFGVYDGRIYHHGAGFRRVFGGRVEAVKAGIKPYRKKRWIQYFNRFVPDRLQWWLFDRNLHPLSKIYAPLERRLKPLSLDVYERIRKNPDYVYVFHAGPSPEKR